MEYQVINGQGFDMYEALKELEQKVKRECQMGWKPQGGISIAIKDYDWFYACQAMVR